MTTHPSIYYPLRLFLMKPFYEWITKNHWTPLVLVDITADPVLEQLRPYSKNNKIAIDIADDAVDNLSFDPDGIRAICYFEQQPTELFFPLSSLISLCAAENGRGIDFAGDDEQEDVLAYLASLEKLKAPPKTAHLQIVRSQNTEASDEN